MFCALHPIQIHPHPCKSHTLRCANGLIEMIFVLLVVVTLLAGSLRLGWSLINESTSNLEADTVSTLADNIRRTKKFDGYAPSADMTYEMIELQLIPDSIFVNTNSIQLKNQWGGAVRLTRQDAGANFAISYANIPSDICKSMMLNIPVGVLQTVGAGTAGSSSGSGSDKLIAELTHEEIAKICENGNVHWSTGS